MHLPVFPFHIVLCKSWDKSTSRGWTDASVCPAILKCSMLKEVSRHIRLISSSKWAVKLGMSVWCDNETKIPQWWICTAKTTAIYLYMYTQMPQGQRENPSFRLQNVKLVLLIIQRGTRNFYTGQVVFLSHGYKCNKLSGKQKFPWNKVAFLNFCNYSSILCFYSICFTIYTDVCRRVMLFMVLVGESIGKTTWNMEAHGYV